MRILTFLEQFPDFLSMQQERKEMWEEIRKQVVTHTRRCEEVELISRRRPGESDDSLQYRIDNYRPITKAPIVESINKSVRIYSESNIDLENASEELKGFLKKKPFVYLGGKVNSWDYWYSCVFPEGLDDPNAAILPFPYNKENPFVPPSLPAEEGGKGTNRRIDILPKLIPSNKIAFAPTDEIPIFCWLAGQKEVRGAEKKTLSDYYYIVDEYDYYILEPAVVNKKQVLVPAFWYNHASGVQIDEETFEPMLPVKFLGGTLTKSEDGSFLYYESYLHPALVYYDEVVCRFSDCGIVASRFGYPDKVFNAEIACQSCKGKGHIKQSQFGIEKPRTCGDCNGTGRQVGDSPFNTYYRKDKAIEKGNSRPLIEYPHADVAIQAHGFDQCFALMEKGDKKIGVSMLENTGANESGKSKAYRLEPSEDFLKSLATGFIGNNKTRFLFFVECLLNSNPRDRIEPVIKLPETYKIQDFDSLTKRAKETFPSLRMTAELEAINKLYEQEPLKASVFNWAYCYCPLMALSQEDWTFRVENGMYNRADVAKVDLMPAIIKEFLSADNIANRDERAFNAFADAYLKANIVEPVEIFQGGGDSEGEGGISGLGQLNTKLLETVGGVTGIVDISRAVAKGEMTEQAAENLIVLLYGIPRNEASSLIEVPEAKIEQALNDAQGNT